MNLNPTEAMTWKRAINPMLTKLGTDLHNHRILADPWQRKAQSMVKAWAVVLRSGRPPHTRRPIRPIGDWETAAVWMLQSLRQREYMRRTRTGWKRWASDRGNQGRLWPAKFQQA